MMNANTLTELDYALNCAAVEIDTTNARAELAQLRVDLQAAQDERDKAKAWHTSLNAMIERKNATIAEQAAQLEQAEQIIVLTNLISTDSSLTQLCRDWIAAKAPQEQPDPQEASRE